jgi:hypothetical protein
MVQPRFLGAEKQSARAQQAVRAYSARAAARVAIQTSKSLSKSRFFSLEVALADIIEALAVFKGVVAESKGQLPPAFREPEQGHGRGDCGNTGGSGEKVAAQQPGLPGLFAEFARTAVDSGGSAGGVDKTPWSFL